jgi:hypothetical protein
MSPIDQRINCSITCKSRTLLWMLILTIQSSNARKATVMENNFGTIKYILELFKNTIVTDKYCYQSCL